MNQREVSRTLWPACAGGQAVIPGRVDMTVKPTFLLLDPPSGADFCRRGSLREKNAAHNAPFPNIDLILLSGAVREAGFSPVYIDAQLNRMNWSELSARLQAEPPVGILSLVSSSSIDDELKSLQRLKSELGGVKLYIVGTIILQREQTRLEQILRENPWLDGVILNPAENQLTELLRSEASAMAEPLNIAVQGAKGPRISTVKVRYGDGLRLPRPEHSIFKDARYCMPQSKHGPVTCVQFSFGCPFTCEFCIDNQLYRKMLYRDVDDMVEAGPSSHFRSADA